MLLTRQFNLFKTKIKFSLNFSTNNHVIISKANNVQIPKISLHQYLWQNLDKWKNKTATICFETQRSYTYQQLYDKSLAVTNFLKNSLKLPKCDTVAVVLPNCPEFPIAILGAVQAGLKVTTCNPNYTPDEIKRQLVDSGSKLVFTYSDLLPVVKEAIAGMNANISIIQLGGGGSDNGVIHFDQVVSGPKCEPVDVSTDDTIFLPYSSGTTGVPKGVELTHFNIVANLQQISSPEFCFISKYDYQDVISGFLPFFHIYGLVVVLLHSLALGAKVVAMPRFTSDNFVNLLKNYKPNIIYGVPLVVNMSINNPNISTKDLESVTSFMSGAAPLGAADVERFRLKTNNKINLIQGYGMTETSPVTIIQSKILQSGIKIGGSGLLVPNTAARIITLDGSMKNLGPNESGELIVKGPQVMKGYYNNPEADKDIFLQDGWLRTGDIAHYDEDGHFYITDRLKELIKVKSFQVAPAELEEILRDHPNVTDAAVVGVPHELLGEAPKAFVVTKSKMAAQELEEYVAAKVSKHKHLTGGVVFVDAIPKNPSGKILRRELKKM